MNVKIFIVVVFAGLGFLFVLIGVLLTVFFRKRREKASAIAAATVADVERRSGSDGRSCYYPVFAYYADGIMRRVTSSFGSSPCRYHVGEEVEIHYNAEKPEQIWVERDEGMKKLCCGIFIGIGSLFFVIGVVLGTTGIVN